MRINFSTGSTPRSLCEYLLRNDKRQSPLLPGQAQEARSMLLASNLDGRSAQELAAEIKLYARENPNVVNTVRNFSFSGIPGEHIPPERKIAITEHFLKRTGHENCPWFAAEHFDRAAESHVEHWHLCVGAVDKDGRWISDSFIKQKIRGLEPEIERTHNLVQVPIRAEKERHNLTTKEHRYKQRMGIDRLPKEILWEKLQKATRDQPSLLDLALRLKADGATVRFRWDEADPEKLRGLSFGWEGSAYCGRSLSKQYSLPGLQRNQLIQQYDERQNQQLRDAEKLPPEQCRLQLAQAKDTAEDDAQIIQPSDRKQEARQLIQQIWQHSKNAFPRLKAASYENFQVEQTEQGQTELFKIDTHGRANPIELEAITIAELECLRAMEQAAFEQFQREKFLAHDR